VSGFLLDTNIPSELTRHQSDPNVEKWLDDADDEQLFLSVVSLGEIFKGLTILPPSKRRHELQQWIEEVLRPWFNGRILPVNEHIAERWGILAGECQRKGRGLTMADGLIAATALEHDLTVVTRNVRDFAGLGAEAFNPWSATARDFCGRFRTTSNGWLEPHENDLRNQLQGRRRENDNYRQPLSLQQQYIEQVRKLQTPIPVLHTSIRENKTIHADAPHYGVPVVLRPVSGETYENVRGELESLTTEVLRKVAL
jgi:toxin FitB